jgi:hypothetical protein
VAAAISVVASAAGDPAIAGPAADLPPAIYTDPSSDGAHPPRMAVVHIPSHGVRINGVAYLAGGAGLHRP